MRRVGKWLLVGALLVVAIAGVSVGWRIVRLSRIGAGYVAKQMCSCVFVSERDFAACRRDMPADMDRVQAALLTGQPGVDAWVSVFAWRVALYTPGTGCTLH